MKPNPDFQATPHDVAAFRTTLLKLTAVHKIICTVVVAIVALVWYDLLSRLVAYGDGIDYAGLSAMGAETVEFLQRYNPFFWWGLVVLCTLLIIYFLYGFVQSSRRRTRNKIVSAETFSELSHQLSEPAKEVMRWAWQDRRNPITVGDLQRAANELRSGRASKIELARVHFATLDDEPQNGQLL